MKGKDVKRKSRKSKRRNIADWERRRMYVFGFCWKKEVTRK